MTGRAPLKPIKGRKNTFDYPDYFAVGRAKKA